MKKLRLLLGVSRDEDVAVCGAAGGVDSET